MKLIGKFIIAFMAIAISACSTQQSVLDNQEATSNISKQTQPCQKNNYGVGKTNQTGESKVFISSGTGSTGPKVKQ
jgi:hypothetical protein